MSVKFSCTSEAHVDHVAEDEHSQHHDAEQKDTEQTPGIHVTENVRQCSGWYRGSVLRQLSDGSREYSSKNLDVVVLAAQQGDRNAFGELWNRHRAIVYHVGIRILKNQHHAEDLCSEVFMHAIETIGQLRDPHSFPGWIRQIAVRYAINIFTRKKVASGELHDDMTEDHRVRTPVGELKHREDRGVLLDAIELLKPVDRETIMRFYYQGQTLKRISREMECPAGTVKRRLHVARNRLRATLHACGFIVDDESE